MCSQSYESRVTLCHSDIAATPLLRSQLELLLGNVLSILHLYSNQIGRGEILLANIHFWTISIETFQATEHMMKSASFWSHNCTVTLKGFLFRDRLLCTMHGNHGVLSLSRCLKLLFEAALNVYAQIGYTQFTSEYVIVGCCDFGHMHHRRLVAP